jgi:serine protease Do
MRRLATWGLVMVLVSAPAPRPASAAAPPALQEIENAISDIAEKIKPSVVLITSEHVSPGLDVPDLPRIPGLPQLPRRTPRSALAAGSGMIFRATNDSYYILTNAHVVRGSKDNAVSVKLLGDAVERKGTVLGQDRLTDVAVVKIDRKPGDKLPAVTLGKSKNLRIGAFVLAVGSPFRFEASVTLGIVSSLDRELDEPGEEEAPTPGPGRGAAPRVRASYTGLIQTDASINPGNSGGPLVDMNGEVVGINFAIYSPGAVGQNVGIGFAIPIEKAIAVIDDLILKGRVARGYLGVMIRDAEVLEQEDHATREDLVAMYGTDSGAFVKEVTPNSPSAQAGVQAGDVVVGVDAQVVKNSKDLQDYVRALKPPAQVQLKLMRDKKAITVPVTVGELSAELTGDAPAGGAPDVRAQAGRDPLGLTVAEPNLADKAQLLKAGQKAYVKVSEVEPESLAAEKEIAVGTFLLEGRRSDDTDRVAFSDPEAYRAFIAKAAKDRAYVTLWVATIEDGHWQEQTETFNLRADHKPANP